VIVSHVVVIAAALGVATFGLARGTWAVGGSDSSCYALMAEAFSRASLQPSSALATDAPWPDASRTFAPGGFIPSPVTQSAASPICAPGFSLFLAPLRWLVGPDGIFVVTPAAGALLVWLTFVLGRRFGGDSAAVAAALVVAATPVMLFQVVQPMNDVLVAMLWTAVAAVAVRPPRPLLLGTLTGMALLVRPNLAPAAAVVLAWTLREGGVRHGWLWVLGLLPWLLALAGLNARLYGHPLASGYGEAGELFALRHVPVNVANYGSALLYTQFGFPLIAAAAPFVLRHERKQAWFLLSLSTVVAGIYLLYTPFAEWWYMRFLLPVIPMLTVVTTATLATIGRTRVVLVASTIAVLALMLGSPYAAQAYQLADLERRFRVAGEVVRDRLPANAVVITVWGSGSVRYHAGREAILWDSLDPVWLDRAVAWLESQHRVPFILVEDWEEPAFRMRFGAHAAYGRLDWPPRYVIARRLRVFATSDRERYRQGEPLRTEPIWSSNP
jgi:hypothetical protein